MEPTQIPAPTAPAWSSLGTTCISEGCGGKQYRRRMCIPCYRRWRYHTPPVERRRPTAAERFAVKVDRRGSDECWPWMGFRRPQGHGQFHVSRERGLVPAHTFARELATGEPCPPGKMGCHHCDNPPCCNPEHIYYGTARENVDDCIERERMPRGEDRVGAKLSENDVIAIRERCAAGSLPKHLAEEFNVDVALIRLIARGVRWVHVGGPIRTHLLKPGVRPGKEVA